PVSIATGSLVEREEDYVSADGLFKVERQYRSLFRRFIFPGEHSVAGFGAAWHGVVPGRIMVWGAYFERIQYFDKDGTENNFYAPV
uniref:DUF6531 domain-containing protein n=1 Tax=Vibrio cholerae TaxID=666 RepID=UPI001F20563A